MLIGKKQKYIFKLFNLTQERQVKFYKNNLLILNLYFIFIHLTYLQ